MVKGVLLFDAFGHICGKWTYNAVAQENAEEGSDQCGCDLVPDLCRWSSQGAHRHDDAKDGFTPPVTAIRSVSQANDTTW